MKKLLSLILIWIISLLSIASSAEGLLPQLGDVYGIGMPSLADVLYCPADSTESMEDGSSVLTYYNVQDGDYMAYGELLAADNCTLQDYSVEETSILCTIAKNGRTFTFAYDTETHQAVCTFPNGTFDDPQKAGRPQEVGSSVFFGWYEQDNDLENGLEPIEWIVLDLQEDRALLISKYALDCQNFHNQSGNWEDSTVRIWLNSTFYNRAFNEEQRKAIILTVVDNSKAQGNAVWTATNDNNTQDKIFLLSFAEVSKALDKKYWICKTTKYASAKYIYSTIHYDEKCGWWLRSHGKTAGYFDSIDYDGTCKLANLNASSMQNCIRPALWVDLNTSDFSMYATTSAESAARRPKPTAWPNTPTPILTAKPTATPKPQSAVPARLLNAKYVLGTTTSEVLEIKKKMQQQGYFSAGAELTGIYNGLMQERIKMFQKDHGLRQTGVIDRTFLETLYSR